jgi:mannosyl-oligosaccharide glucosidase
MAGYGWAAMNRDGGVQNIPDSLNKINLTTEFVRIPGTEHGGGWAVRVKGVPRRDAPKDLHTTIIFYIGTEEEAKLKCSRRGGQTVYQETVECQGNAPGLGGFEIQLPVDPNAVGHVTRLKSLVVPANMVWDGKCRC